MNSKWIEKIAQLKFLEWSRTRPILFNITNCVFFSMLSYKLHDEGFRAPQQPNQDAFIKNEEESEDLIVEGSIAQDEISDQNFREDQDFEVNLSTSTTSKFSLIGKNELKLVAYSCALAPAMHAFYTIILPRIVPLPTKLCNKGLFKMVMADFLIAGSLLTAAHLAIFEYPEFQEVMTNLRKSGYKGEEPIYDFPLRWLSYMIADFPISAPLQYLNFRLVPIRFRTLYIYSTGFLTAWIVNFNESQNRKKNEKRFETELAAYEENIRKMHALGGNVFPSGSMNAVNHSRGGESIQGERFEDSGFSPMRMDGHRGGSFNPSENERN